MYLLVEAANHDDGFLVRAASVEAASEQPTRQLTGIGEGLEQQRPVTWQPDCQLAYRHDRRSTLQLQSGAELLLTK